MSRTLLIDDFSGAVNKSASPEKLEPNECQIMDWFTPTEGGLQTTDGMGFLTGGSLCFSKAPRSCTRFYKTGHPVNEDDTTPFYAWKVVYSESGGVGEVWAGQLRLYGASVTTAAAKDAASIALTLEGTLLEIPTHGSAVINGHDVVTFTGVTNPTTASPTLTGCGEHPAYVAGETVQVFQWFPICANNMNLTPMSFASMGGNLYFTSSITAATTATRLMRWNGSYYNKGTADCAGSSTTVTGTGTDWDSFKSVQQGDLIFLESASVASIDTTKPYRIVHIHNGTTLILNTNGHATLDSTNRYIIARVHPAGIDLPSATGVTCADSAGAGIAAGTYHYVFTYCHADPDGTILYESAPSADYSATTHGTDLQVTISPPTEVHTTRSSDLYSDRWQVNRIRYYRTTIGTTGPYYLVAADSPSADTYLFTDYVDTKADSALDTSTSPPTANDEPPVGLTGLAVHSGKLHGWGVSTNLNRLYFSTLNEPELWPTHEYSNYTTTDATRFEGGYVDMFPVGQEITAAITEGGAFGLTGVTGAPLRVFTQFENALWSGNDHQEYIRSGGFGVGCISARTLVDADGILIWCSRSGPVMMQVGTNSAVPMYAKVFPQANRRFSKVLAGDESYLNIVGQRAASAYWNGHYLLSWAESESTNDRFAMWDVRTGNCVMMNETGTQVAEALYSHLLYINDFCVWDGSGDNSELTAITGLSTYYPIQLFVQSTVKATATTTQTYWFNSGGGADMGCKWRSKLYTLADQSDEVDWTKRVRRMAFAWHGSRAACVSWAKQYALVNIYTNGDMTNTRYTEDVSPSVDTTGQRVITQVFPAINGESFCFDIETCNNERMTLEWIRVEYDMLRPSKGTQVG